MNIKEASQYDVKEILGKTLGELSLDILTFTLALIGAKEENAELGRQIDIQYGRIDSQIALDTNLANDWRRYDRQREWREGDHSLQSLITQRRGLWNDINLAEAYTKYVQLIRENRIAEMLSHSTLIHTALSPAAELN
jgi:hypothetical protein